MKTTNIIYNPTIPYQSEINKNRYNVYLKKVKQLEIQLRASEINKEKISTYDFRNMLRKSKADYKRGLGDIYGKLFLKYGIIKLNENKSVVWCNNENIENNLKKCYIEQHDYCKSVTQNWLKHKSIDIDKEKNNDDKLKVMIEQEVKKQLSNFFSSFK